MPVLLVAGSQPRQLGSAAPAGAGKTAFVAAITQRLAYDGRRVLALRLGGSGDPHAAADAAFFATLPGARGRGGAPVPADSAPAEVRRLAGDGIAVVEAGASDDPIGLAAALDATTLLVYRGLPDDDAILHLQEQALALEARFLGVALAAVPERAVASVRSLMDDAALPLIAAVPEDRVLYAPTIGEIAEQLDAELLLGDEAEGEVIENLMIGPVSSDPGQPYYAREGNKAIITRSDKTDLQLAALQTDTACLILTGGLSPSPYTLDRASNEEIAVMLTRAPTRDAVSRLEDIFLRSRFGSERKLERMAELLRDRLDYEAITAALT